MENNRKSTIINSDYEKKKAQMLSLIEITLKGLSQGTIRVSLIKMLDLNKKVLNEMLGLFSEQLDFKFWTNANELDQTVNKVLEYRLMEVENLKKFKQVMKNLFELLRSTDSFRKS